MERVFSIIMLAMTFGTLIAAGVIRKDYQAIPRNYASNPDDKQAYAKMVARILRAIAGIFGIGGIVGWFFGNRAGAIAFGAAIAVAGAWLIVIAVFKRRGKDEKHDGM